MPRALACPASLKGVLGAADAAEALAAGLRAAGWEVDEQPVADGGEGTLEALHAALGGSWHTVWVPDAYGAPREALWLELPDGSAVVEAAEAIPLDPSRLDPETASSRGLGELIAAVGRRPALLVGLGGTATMDAGRGLLEVVERLPAPTRVAFDTRARLHEAPRRFGPQKGADQAAVARLERAFAALPLPDVEGGGAAGGLGAALASLGAELVPGAALVLDAVGLDPRGYDLVVTGEGTVDSTSATGKAPAEVARRCAEAGVRCVVFGGRVEVPLPGAETVALSGLPARAREDLVELGRRLGGGS